MPPQLEDVFLTSHRQSAMLLQTNMAAHLRNEIKQRMKLERKVPFQNLQAEMLIIAVPIITVPLFQQPISCAFVNRFIH